jgi:hypothetical protein
MKVIIATVSNILNLCIAPFLDYTQHGFVALGRAMNGLLLRPPFARILGGVICLVLARLEAPSLPPNRRLSLDSGPPPCPRPPADQRFDRFE